MSGDKAKKNHSIFNIQSSKFDFTLKDSHQKSKILLNKNNSVPEGACEKNVY